MACKDIRLILDEDDSILSICLKHKSTWYISDKDADRIKIRGGKFVPDAGIGFRHGKCACLKRLKI